MTVRRALPADFPFAAAALAAASPHEGDLASHETRLHEEHARTIARVTVAVDERDTVVGALVAWHVADEVTIHDVAVDPARRRGGHGRALVAELVAYARGAAARLVLLEVRSGNVAARALYAAFGFEEVHVRRRYYADGEDAIELQLAI